MNSKIYFLNQNINGIEDLLKVEVIDALKTNHCPIFQDELINDEYFLLLGRHKVIDEKIYFKGSTKYTHTTFLDQGCFIPISEKAFKSIYNKRYRAIGVFITSVIVLILYFNFSGFKGLNHSSALLNFFFVLIIFVTIFVGLDLSTSLSYYAKIRNYINTNEYFDELYTLKDYKELVKREYLKSLLKEEKIIEVEVK